MQPSQVQLQLQWKDINMIIQFGNPNARLGERHGIISKAAKQKIK